MTVAAHDLHLLASTVNRDISDVYVSQVTPPYGDYRRREQRGYDRYDAFFAVLAKFPVRHPRYDDPDPNRQPPRRPTAEARPRGTRKVNVLSGAKLAHAHFVETIA